MKVIVVSLLLSGLVYAQEAPPVANQPAPTRVFSGAKLFIEDTGEFGMALAASFIDKKVPVTVVSDPEKADFVVRSVSQDRKAGQAEKVTRILAFGAFGGSGDRYHAVVSIVNREGSVVFAYNVKKGNFQDAANSTVNEIKKKQINKRS